MVVSGFHSPLEQSVLKVLIEAHHPVVAVLARPVSGARLPPEWVEPLAQGLMAAVSITTDAARLTEEAATARNMVVAQLAARIVVAHASPGGALDSLCAQWRADERQIVELLRM